MPKGIGQRSCRDRPSARAVHAGTRWARFGLEYLRSTSPYLRCARDPLSDSSHHASARGDGTHQLSRLSGARRFVRAAVRVNDDGTVDFAACTTIVSVETAVAEVTLHADRGDRDAETRSLELVTGLADVSEGETMTFSGLPEDWDELEVYVYGREGGAVKGIDRDEVIVGEWFWGYGLSFFPTIYATDARCQIE